MAVIEQHRNEAFRWGAYDCATLFADAVQAVTGVDPLAKYRPWKNERSARMKMIRAGYSGMRDFARANFPEVPPSFAGRGDLGFPAKTIPISCPAVIIGSEAVSRDQDGWICIPTSLLVTTFKVG